MKQSVFRKEQEIPDWEKMNEEKFEKLLESFCPQLFYIYQALNDAGIDPSIVVDFVFQLRNVLEVGWGKVWIDILDGKPTFIKAERRIKVLEES